MAIYKCSNPTRHPTLHRIEMHHNPPRSWTNDNGASSTLYPLCGTCHNEVHALLNEYVRAGHRPYGSVRRSYAKFVLELAADAWSRRVQTKPPFTSAHDHQDDHDDEDEQE